MSKYRKIDPRIWNDEHFRPLSDSAKLLFLFLLTHPHLTALGAMRATPAGLADELRWSEKRICAALEEISTKPFIKLDANASYLALINFLMYNKPENPNVLKSWESALDYIPECDLKRELMLEVKAFAEGLGEAFAKALPEPFLNAKAFRHPLPNHEQEQEQEQEHINPPIVPLSQHSIDEIVIAWNSTTGVVPVRKVTGQRKLHLKTRLSESDWPWKEALAKFPLPCFANDGGWKPTLDWFVRPDTADSILEGKYDWRKDHSPPGKRPQLATDEDKQNYNPCSTSV